MTALKLLLLLVVANSAPVLARDLFGERGGWPLDGGRRWRDGRPLLGRSKTLRGLLAATVATAAVGWTIGAGAGFGALIGLTAMAGDALSSFVKRRLALPSSARATGLDQLPEALLPTALAALLRPLGVVEALVVVALFFALEVLLSPLLYRLGIRRRPY